VDKFDSKSSSARSAGSIPARFKHSDYEPNGLRSHHRREHPLIRLRSHQFRTRNDLIESQQTRSHSDENARKSTNTIFRLPLIAVWLQVAALSEPTTKSIVFRLRILTPQMRGPSHIRMPIGPDRTAIHSCSSTLRFVLFVRHSYAAAIPALQISFLLEMSTILLPQTDHGSGRRHERQGRKDPDQGIRVVRQSANATCHEAPSQEPWHAAAGDVRYRYAAGQLSA
jgi:hypothetical protein